MPPVLPSLDKSRDSGFLGVAIFGAKNSRLDTRSGFALMLAGFAVRLCHVLLRQTFTLLLAAQRITKQLRCSRKFLRRNNHQHGACLCRSLIWLHNTRYMRSQSVRCVCSPKPPNFTGNVSSKVSS